MLALKSLTLTLLLTTAAAAQDPVITLSISQPTYEIGQTIFLEISGTPGASAFLGIAENKQTTTVPGIGDLCIDPSDPSFLLIGFPSLPPTGTVVLCDGVPCDPSLAGLQAFVQAVQISSGQVDGISNCVEVELVDGDCTDECDGGIVILGVQTTLTNLDGATGSLQMSGQAHNKADAIGELTVNNVDLNALPALPISNADGSVKLVKLEWDGDSLLVRWELDASNYVGSPGRAGKMSNETNFSTSFGNAAALEQIHTSCSQPLPVGMVFGEYVVTRLID